MCKVWDEKWLADKMESGLTYYEIAELSNCSHTTVQKWARKHGLEPKGKSKSNTLTPEASQKLNDADWLRERYSSGDMTIGEIAQSLGCSRSTVQKYIREADIERVGTGANVQSGPDHYNWKGGVSPDVGPDWEEKRELALERDGYHCVVCGMDEETHKTDFDRGLAVHHIIPRRKFENDDGTFDHEQANDLGNLITLCVSCHRDWEGVFLRPQVADC